jgi:3-oxoacyl-[acyl-carrier-protein] synthase II
MPERRVAITGLGVVTAAGTGMDPLWDALLTPRSCLREITPSDGVGLPGYMGGQIEDFSAREFVPKSYRKAVKLMARDIEIAVAAAALATKDAGLVTRAEDADRATFDSRRFGCNIGAGLVNADLDELGEAAVTAVVDGVFSLREWGAGGMENLTPLWLLKYLPNMLSCHVTIIHGCEGPSNTVTCGDASGHLAIGEAGRWILRGAADAALAGGGESKVNPMGMMRQQLLGRLCGDGADALLEPCRPFDSRHCGTVVGEGGGVLVLEELDGAVARGARIYAELVGFGAASDPAGVDVTRPTVGGIGRAVGNALRDAGVTGEDVGLIVAHGTGLPSEDQLESRAWEEALGDALGRVPVVAVTGAIGSLFAGSGAVEVALACKALQEQRVPATVGFDEPAPDCRLSCAPKVRPLDATYAVAGGFSVGGHSAACVLKKYEG